MTNGDKIRAMSDEELAWELMVWRCEAVSKHHGPEEIELLAKQRDLYMDACGELPLKRIRELAQADREGRCFTSPVKIGQTVWFVRDPKRNPENIVETTVEKIVCKRGGTYMKLGCNSMYETSCNSIGKTVFLTRAEAQAALRREQDG